MKKLHKSFSLFALNCALVFSILFGLSVSAQTYPVQTNISTTAPYLNYLSYYGDQNNHLQVTVTYLDFTLPPELVRLRIRIEGSGWELYTNPNATIGQPFLLEAGMPLTITGIDLLPYLQESNLINPSGVDLNNLPHGFTTFCVDVIRQSASQQVLSSNSCGFLPIQEYQPPQTFVPSCGSVLDTNTMFHTFTWTPPIPFPAGVGLELFYDFSIYQWVDPNNNSAMGGNSILIYEQTDLIAPTTQVSDFDVIFELGRTYVWKVTARVESNGIPISLIENGGVSAPCTFIYGEAPTLADVLGDGLEIELFTSPSSERKGKAWWTVTDNTPNVGLSTFDAYFVEYRKQPTGNEGFVIPWFFKTLSSFEHFIYQLEPSTTYEVKVSGVIAGSIGDPTPVETFTTPDPRIYNCGESDVPYLPSNYTPLENATVGTQVKIGQFMMTITEVVPLGQAGHYAGKGEIPIAFLANAKAKVRFTDILIDTEYLVHEGRVDVITEGLANWLDDQYQQFIDPYFVEGTIDSAYVQDSLAWVVVDGVAQSFVFDPPNYPIIVNDESGNQYTIYPNGTIVVGTYLSVSETWAIAANETARFGQNANETRGFDPMEHTEWYENYETMQLSDNTFYYVANKSMAKGETDKVNVQFPPSVTAMSFELANGTPIPVSPLEGAWMGDKPYLDSGLVKTLTIPSFSSAGKYEIYAFANNEKVGQLNIHVYSKKEKEVIVVPIASTTITEAQIKAELDRTLGEANIDVTVTMNPQWTDPTGTFTASTNISLPSDVGLLTKYSDDMRELRDAYFDANPSAPKNKYYLFLVNGFNDPNELGYMVRGRSMGFIKASNSAILSTISHELGHGMGALEHTWKNNGVPKGTSNNLMDYEVNPNQLPKDNLTKAQWKELRDLDVIPSLWDSAEDASLSGDIVHYYKVKLSSTGKVLSREWWKRENYVRLYKDANSDGNWDEPPFLYDGTIDKSTVVNYIFDEAGQLTTSYRYKNVVYYDYNWINGAWVRTFNTHSDHITLSNYDFPVSYVYTIKKFYRNNELIAEKVYNWNGDRMDVSKLASNVSPLLSIHARGAEFLANHLESGVASYMPNSQVNTTGVYKVSDGYNVVVYTMELGYTDATMLSELTIHIPNTATRYDMQDLFREYGLVQNMSYEYSLFIRNVPDTWARYGNWSDGTLDGAQGGSPPFVIQLFADVLMGLPSAAYGFMTGENLQTGATLTGWDHVWNSLEIIPVAGLFAKTFKHGVKGLKIYNKTTGVFFDVVQAAKKMPSNMAAHFSQLQQKGLRVAASVENELYIVVNQTGEKIAKIKDKVVEILKPYTGSSTQPQWSLDLGNMQVKVNGNIVEESVEIRKYGNEVRVVANLSGKSNIIAKLNALGDLIHAKNFVNSLDDVVDASLLAKLEKLTNKQLQGLDDFYSAIKFPQGYSGQLNYTATKIIDGQTVSITYKNGLPDLDAYSPILNFTDGSVPSKFKFEATNLNGGSTDFSKANSSLAKKFGIEKSGGSWPAKDSKGYLISGNYRWKPTSSQFELFENNKWVKYTWHHFEDGKTMLPVKSKIHTGNLGGFPHSGGKSIIKNGLKGLFEFISF